MTESKSTDTWAPPGPLNWWVRASLVLLTICAAALFGLADARLYRAGFMHWFLIVCGCVTGASLVVVPTLVVVSVRKKRRHIARAIEIMENGPRGEDDRG